MKPLARISIGLAALAAAAWLALPAVASTAARKLNRVLQPGPYAVSPPTRALHDRLTIVDLHADPLLWSRDLDARGSWGHIDVPRLLEANVALQVFGVVTKTPRKMNVDHNDASSDEIQLLPLAEHWPPGTWPSLRARALYQAEKLRGFAERSDGKLSVIHDRAELAAFLQRRARDPHQVGALLALEGMQALEGDPANVDVLYDAGFRILGPAHFFDDEMAGSAHGVEKSGSPRRAARSFAAWSRSG